MPRTPSRRGDLLFYGRRQALHEAFHVALWQSHLTHGKNFVSYSISWLYSQGLFLGRSPNWTLHARIRCGHSCIRVCRNYSWPCPDPRLLACRRRSIASHQLRGAEHVTPSVSAVSPSFSSLFLFSAGVKSAPISISVLASPFNSSCSPFPAYERTNIVLR